MLSKALEVNVSLRQNYVFSPVVIIIESQMTTIKFVGKNTLIWHTVLTSFISTYLNFFQLLSGFMFPNSFLIRFLIV